MTTGTWGYLSGAAGAVDGLRRAGVTRIFGSTAVDATDLFEAFLRSPIQVVLVTHEQCAAHMADAHARVTGELSACLLRPGPGLTNSLGGIAAARMDSSPMIVLLAGSSARHLNERDSPPWMPYSLAGALPLCKGFFEVTAPEEVPSVLAQAVQLARNGEPGPVLLEIPATVQRCSGRMEGTGFKTGPRMLSDEAVAGLEKVAGMIQRSRVVGIYAGAGCFQATDEIAGLAERLDAPVATTISGLGVLPEIHPLCAGFGLGRAGAPLAEKAFSRCNLVLAVGCKLHRVAQAGSGLVPGAELVHIDIGPRIPDATSPTSVVVKAPEKQALRFLLDRAEEKSSPEIREIIRQGKSELKKAIAAREDWTDAVDPVKFFTLLREQLSGEDVLVLDSGRHAFFGIASYPVQAPRTLLAPVDYQALGFSVPAAVGAKLALPRITLVACVGDGGFLLTGLELLTARRCNVAPVVVIFTEAQVRPIRSLPDRIIGRETRADLIPVNYEELARALDVGYVRILRDSEIEAGLIKALTMEAPVVVELRVAYREAAPFLKAAQGADWQRLPRPLALRLGARLILRRLLNQ